MKILGFEFQLRRKNRGGNVLGQAIASGGGGWWPLLREPYAGAWQQNMECTPELMLSFYAVFACITQIASDIAKLRFKLEKADADGVYIETTSSAFSPVLAKPNNFQNHIQFKENWMLSKLRTGNAYILLGRNGRGNVTTMHVLDPARVMPLITPDGTIFYQLSSDNIVGIEEASVIVPASEIIHDRMNCLFHPLIGVSPLFAAALPALVGLKIENNTAQFFANGAKISGVITAPGAISPENATAVSTKFNEGYTRENSGKVAVLGDGLKFQPLTMNSTDAQLIQTLNMTGQQICSIFHVPSYMVNIGTMPNLDNVTALKQDYFDKCLHVLIASMELGIDEGMATPDNYNACLDLDDLLRMDVAQQFSVYGEGVKQCILTPNEARKKLGLPKVVGGDTIYMQQQNYSLDALSKRDALPDPFIQDVPTKVPTPGGGGEPNADPTAAPAEDPNAQAQAEKTADAFLRDVMENLKKNFAEQNEHAD